MIAAHDSPLAALAFDPSGELLATASEKGTIIRVFLVSEGTRVHEFRRGLSQGYIYTMAFSQDSQFMVLNSNKETIHLFKLSPDTQDEQNKAQRPPR